MMSRSFLAIAVSALALVPTLGAQPSPSGRCGAGVLADEKRGSHWWPRGDVFCRLVADPKEVTSFASILRQGAGDSLAGRELEVASFGIGDSFGLYRWNGGRGGDGIQVALSAAVFAQFDLGQSNFDLLNADYTIGLPITIRLGWFSTRLRVYHQSSHLGDGFFEEEPTDEMLETLSYYSAEGILSADAGPLRFYAGGEYLFARTPEDLAIRVLHAGAELRPGFRIIPLGSLGGLRLVAAGDVKSSEEQEWEPAWSLRGGLEYGRGDGDVSARRWSILVEYYDGPAPYGQFFREKVRFAGLGIHFGGF